jgi:hypothetical protein
VRAFETKISELSEEQKSHLAWRLEHYTFVGYVTAIRIVKGEFGDSTLFEVFEKAGMNPQRAKIHSSRVCNFNTSMLEKIKKR